MASSSFSAPLPYEFTGQDYPIWEVKMKTYLKAFDFWEVVETSRDPPALGANHTLAQIKQHSDKCAKGCKALACIQSVVSK